MKDLTVFIIQCGEETLDECVKSVESQEAAGFTYQYEMIKDVYPMSSAFNEMHRRCRTPYFIQVDADMVLYRNAVSELYREIKKSFFLTYMVFAQLNEEGFGPVAGIRCWKTDIVRFFKFRDVRTVDRDFYRRAGYFGLRHKNIRKMLGLHKPKHSPFSEYLKAKSDIEKLRFLKMKPDRHALVSLQTLITEKEGYKLLGILLGALTNRRRYSLSKDVSLERRRYGEIKDAFGYMEDEPISMNPESLGNPDEIERLFEVNYFDFKNMNAPGRKALLELVCGIFAKSISTVDMGSLEAIISY